MADDKQLQSARVTLDTTGPIFPELFNTLEAALAYILGVTLDTDTEPIGTIDPTTGALDLIELDINTSLGGPGFGITSIEKTMPAVPTDRQLLTAAALADPSFAGGISHHDLADLTTGNDHTQYLLRSGNGPADPVTGSIYLGTGGGINMAANNAIECAAGSTGYIQLPDAIPGASAASRNAINKKYLYDLLDNYGNNWNVRPYNLLMIPPSWSYGAKMQTVPDAPIVPATDAGKVLAVKNGSPYWELVDNGSVVVPSAAAGQGGYAGGSTGTIPVNLAPLFSTGVCTASGSLGGSEAGYYLVTVNGYVTYGSGPCSARVAIHLSGSGATVVGNGSVAHIKDTQPTHAALVATSAVSAAGPFSVVVNLSVTESLGGTVSVYLDASIVKV